MSTICVNNNINERRHVICVKTLETKQLTFIKGAEYDANKINTDWWIIDSVGVKEKQFKIHFKQI